MESSEPLMAAPPTEQKEFAVVIKDAADFDEIHEKIITDYGDDSIPNRQIEIANYRPGSERITHYMLTEEEAVQLRTNPKIQSVEVPPHLNPRLKFTSLLKQDATFTKTSTIIQSDVNWGLLRCTKTTDTWGSGVANSIGSYNYTLTGKGVDVVILDGGITPNHPEWTDSNGVSRLQQIDWYTASGLAGTQSANHYLDYDGHGSHVTSIAAGRTQGWARNSRIYFVKNSGLAGSEGGGISGSDMFDVIRLWHNNKPVDPNTGYKRPTVVNMSFGIVATEYSASLPSVINYRGTNYNRGTDYTTLDQMKNNYGWMGFLSGGYYYHPYWSSTYEAEVQDMVNAGIHVVVAAGNYNLKIDVPGGDDYNNYWGGYADSYYHRGSAPGTRYAVVVGNISTSYNSSLETRSSSSESGPGVHVYAPGTYIMGVSSKDNAGTNKIVTDYSLTTVPSVLDSNYNMMKITGTSMAAPQVVGILACLLELNPGLTPAQAKAWLINKSLKNMIYDTGGATSYNSSTSLTGGNNNFLFNPFNNSDDGKIQNGLTILNGTLRLV